MSPAQSKIRFLLALAAAVSFLLIFHSFGLGLLPYKTVHIPPGAIRPYPGAKSFGYVYENTGGEPDEASNPRSRMKFFENSVQYQSRVALPDSVLKAGGDRYSHQPGRIVFSSTDNTDPRTNGRRYDFALPIAYGRTIGGVALLVFFASIGGLWWIPRNGGPIARTPAPAPDDGNWRWQWRTATALFAVGLYLNTGTLTPYAITTFGRVDPTTGYAFNPDHEHFRVLFDFVDGRGRAVWDHALFLRRILFPVLGWPLMKTLGFETGGTLASLALNVSAFAAALFLLRRQIGERGAIMAGWLMALYPGAMYWGGLPYPYALIFPGSLLLMIGLVALGGARGSRLMVLSLGMGTVYLGYELGLLFVPATILYLAWRRRFGAACVSAILQAAPTAAWVWALAHVYRQSLENSNSASYRLALQAYFHVDDVHLWWEQIAKLPTVGMDVFFGANFIFLPALFLAVLVLDPLTSRVRLHAAEAALLLSGLALFLFLNAAPSAMGGWSLQGSWASRLYQPVFPALVFFIARWWQHTPSLGGWIRPVAWSALALAAAGNALIVLGPILNDPLHISERAYYRFYNHTESHWIYEANLKALGRRPLGFPKPPPPEPTPAERLAAMNRELVSVRQGIAANRRVLEENERSAHAAATELAAAQSDLRALRSALRQIRGEAAPAAPDPGPATPTAPAIISKPVAPDGPLPLALPEAQEALGKEMRELSGLQENILEVQGGLASKVSELIKTQKELTAARQDYAKAMSH